LEFLKKKYVLVERTGMWIKLTLYTFSFHYKNGKQVVFLEPCRIDVFNEISDRGRIFKNYICSVFGNSEILESRNIIEIGEDLSTIVEAVLEISESEKEIWEEAQKLTPTELPSYFHKILLARRLGRNE
jgi:hypothetical protein